MPSFEIIAFDADDTLWHNERHFVAAQAAFKELLAHYHSPEWIDERLFDTESRNLEHYGFGVKAFALSMIETAVELTEGRIAGEDIQRLIALSKDMLAAEVELLDHAAETVSRLTGSYPLMIITKGELHHQERKIADSGLAHHFRHVEIVSSKNPEVYDGLLRRYAIPRERFLMVGNSLRSDILPVLEVGGSAVWVPHTFTWRHELAEPPSDHRGFHELEHLGLLPALLARLAGGGSADPGGYRPPGTAAAGPSGNSRNQSSYPEPQPHPPKGAPEIP